MAAAHGAAVVATHIRLAPRVPDPEPVYHRPGGRGQRFPCSTVQSGPWRRASRPSGWWWTPGWTWARQRASHWSYYVRRPPWPAWATPSCCPRPTRPSSGSSSTWRSPNAGRRRPPHMPWASPWAAGCARPRRAGHVPGAGHAGRHPGGPVRGWPVRGGTLSGEAVGAAPERLAWLITGDNPSLVAEAVSNLVSQLVEGVDRSLVLEDYGGEDLDLGVVVDACATPPFLADRRVVVLRDAGSHTADQLQPLSAYLEDPLPTTRLVVASGGGNLPAKFVNAFKQAPGATVLNTDVSNREAHGWFSQRLAHAPVKLAPAAAALVEEHLGEDLDRLTALLATLEAAYGHGARIDEERPEALPGRARLGTTLGSDRGHRQRRDRDGPEGAPPPARRRRPPPAGRLGHPAPPLRQRPAAAVACHHLRSGGGTGLGGAQRAQYVPRPQSSRRGPAARRRGTGDAIMALADAELALKGKARPAPWTRPGGPGGPPLPALAHASPGQARLPSVGTRDAVRWRRACPPAPAAQPTSAVASAEAAARAA